MNIRAIGLVGLLTIGSGVGVAEEVAIAYSLLPAATEGEMTRGQIVLQVTNVSGGTLDDVSVRAEFPAAGHLFGPVLDAVDLAVGEVVVLHGDYVMDAGADQPGNGIAWRVSWRDGAAEAREDIVTGVRQD